jgi:hypothetical protein
MIISAARYRQKRANQRKRHHIIRAVISIDIKKAGVSPGGIEGDNMASAFIVEAKRYCATANRQSVSKYSNEINQISASLSSNRSSGNRGSNYTP